MTINIESEVSPSFKFDYKEIINKVIEAATDYCKCPYDIEVNVLLTDNASIHEINKETRGIDRPTDVLSFPAIEFQIPGDFSVINEDDMSYFNMDTGELILGDIVISCDKVISQAQEYGHSTVREIAFLTVHSMLHLFGYDHMEKDGDTMERLQEDILTTINIFR